MSVSGLGGMGEVSWSCYVLVERGGEGERESVCVQSSRHAAFIWPETQVSLFMNTRFHCFDRYVEYGPQ